MSQTYNVALHYKECYTSSPSSVQILPPRCMLLELNLHSFLFFSLSQKKRRMPKLFVSLNLAVNVTDSVIMQNYKGIFWFLVGVVWRRKSIFIHLEWVTFVGLLRSDVVLVFLAVTELLIDLRVQSASIIVIVLLWTVELLHNYILFLPFQ